MKILGIVIAIAGATAAAGSAATAAASSSFVIRVVDGETGRGVPLVRLELPNAQDYWTDSAGVAVLDEPSFAGRDVFLKIGSHGYEYPGETLFGRGLVVHVEPGATLELAVRRTMIAERLYRLTGEGIYRDSVLAGLPVPAEHPLLNGLVLGQDTVAAAVYRGRIFWIWGDTVGTNFWNFHVAAATSDPADDPEVAVNFRYFCDDRGRAREMLPHDGKGLVWIEGLVVLADPQGRERLLATWTRQDGLEFPVECGLALFDDAQEVFRPWAPLPCRDHHVASHPFRHDGWIYLYPWLRAPDDWEAIRNPETWEEREVSFPEGLGRPDCVAWNSYRQRWIALFGRFGDVYYAESARPEGPYGNAVPIIDHDHYNFYNVTTHPFFNREDGRVVFIEGTYTAAFTDAAAKTPRYDYNQVMYRLRLDDLRLRPAHH